MKLSKKARQIWAKCKIYWQKAKIDL